MQKDFPEWQAVWPCCWARLASWRTPPRWSARDWRDELHDVGLVAAWQAKLDFEPERGVPLNAFVYGRVMAAAKTRFRQEWKFASRFGGSTEVDDSVAAPESPQNSSAAIEALEGPLSILSESDRWLVERLFLLERTEAEVADLLGITQQAVSKRKQAILQRLHRYVSGRPESAE